METDQCLKSLNAVQLRIVWIIWQQSSESSPQSNKVRHQRGTNEDPNQTSKPLCVLFTSYDRCDSPLLLCIFLCFFFAYLLLQRNAVPVQCRPILSRVKPQKRLRHNKPETYKHTNWLSMKSCISSMNTNDEIKPKAPINLWFCTLNFH